MSRNRVTYQSEAAYVGPPIISGALLTDSVEPLERVQSLSYSIEIPRADVSQAGKAGLVGSPILQNPQVDGEISYLCGSFRNEKSIGLNFNYNSTNAGDSLANTFNTSLISGFSSTENRNLDRKNIYVSLAEEGVDVVDNVNGITSVAGFSKCYINRWTSKGSVNSMVQNSVSFTACDIQYFNSTGTINMPVINFKKTRNLATQKVVLPTYEATGVSVLSPRDIELSITKLDDSNIDDIGISFNDVKIQEFTLELNLQRRGIESIGYRIPLDYELVSPVTATLSVNGLVANSATGSVFALLNDDERYNVELNMYSFLNCVSGAPSERNISNKYIMKKARLDRAAYASSIGDNKTVGLGFGVDLDPLDLSKGLFLSGFINT